MSSYAQFPQHGQSSAVRTTVTLTSRTPTSVETRQLETFQGGAIYTQTREYEVSDDGYDTDSDVELPAAPAGPQLTPAQQLAAQNANRDHGIRVINHNLGGTRAAPRIEQCACLQVPATPVTLPWIVPNEPTLNPNSVAAVGMIHKTHTLERMRQMVPYLEGKCRIYNTTPAEVAITLMALHNIHWGGNQSETISEATRNKVLGVALEMYGATASQPAQAAIDNARQQPWTRTIAFAGETALTALMTTSITGTAAAATYMAGAWVGAKIGSAKAAATLGGKFKAGALATAGTVGTVALGATTAVAGGASVIWWASTIHAYRDVWDNSFAKDAFFFHQMRDHHVLPGNATDSCRHRSGEWTSINKAMVVGKRGIRWN